MIVEIALKKMLEEQGFTQKNTKTGSVFTYDHIKYRTVNYDKNGDIYFNYLAKYMRNEVKKSHGTIISLNRTEKERLYRQVLSKMGYYEGIKNNIKFSLRNQEGGDYVGISEKVGMDILSEVLQFIITDSGSEILSSRRQFAEEFLPDWLYVKTVIDLIEDEAPTIDEILDAIEKKAHRENKVLKKSWREITRRNIPLWLVAYPG